MELPKGFTLPDKIGKDWNLIKDANNFCSKIGNDQRLHFYGHEIMVSINAYCIWVDAYNALKEGELYDGTDKEHLYFRTVYSETKARLILNGTEPKDAGGIAQHHKNMMFFLGEYKDITEFTAMVAHVPVEPFENLRKKERVERTIHIEHSLGSAKITIEGIDHVFEIPKVLSGMTGSTINLWDNEGNIRLVIEQKKALFGYPSEEPCAVCGSFNNNQSEPRFCYTVCEDHQSVPPTEIHKDK